MSNEDTPKGGAKDAEEARRAWRPSLMPAHRTPIDPAARAPDLTVRHRPGELGHRSLRSYLKQPLVKAGIAISVAIAAIIAVDAALDDDWAQKTTSQKAAKRAGTRSAG
jgi:hypothetical protein